MWRYRIQQPMKERDLDCVLLADRHYRLMEEVRSLLGSTFGVVVMVADELSLFESAKRLQAPLAVLDLSLTPGEGPALVRRLRFRFPNLKLIVLSVHDEPFVTHTVLQAGANGFVLKRTIGADLLPAVDAVLAGQRYVSPVLTSR